MTDLEVLAKSVSKETEDKAVDARIAHLLQTVGNRVRKARSEIGLSRRALSERSGVSQRYLAQLETGQSNISLALLMRIAEALDTRIGAFINEPLSAGASPDNEHLVNRIAQASEVQRAEVMRILEASPQSTGPAQRIALIGLRGAGKSTLGELAAHKLGIDFLELNEEIERASGIAINEVIELYGQEGYRHLEFQALERVAKAHDRLVIAVAGGIVSQLETYNYLLKNYHTIWLKAEPEEHMDRVRAQGDERPMAGNPDAMNELRHLLKNREAYYARASTRLNTSGTSLDDTLDRLLVTIRKHAFLTS